MSSPRYHSSPKSSALIFVQRRYSGVAWATISDFEKGSVHPITNWPGTGREEGKALTELCYEDDGISWGYDTQPESDPVRWFKLMLLKNEDLDPEVRDSEFLVRARRMMKENGKIAVDFIADHLRALWTHAISAINKARGEAIVESLAFHVVITVPAIWKDYARQIMREAVQNAGILDWRLAGSTKLTFAPEPEAAALCTLYELSDGVQDGNVYVIYDAGGGTVVCTQSHLEEWLLMYGQGYDHLQDQWDRSNRDGRGSRRSRY